MTEPLTSALPLTSPTPTPLTPPTEILAKPPAKPASEPPRNVMIYPQDTVIPMRYLHTPKHKRASNPLQSFNPDGAKQESVSFTEIVEELKTKYNFEESITSTTLDILALYLKGQKILHIEAKTLCERRLNTLMLPAIIISSICAILNFALQGFPYGSIIISSCNVFNAFLMGLISYLKLDAKSQAHQSSSYKFQKLEAECEFNSGRILFFKDGETSIKTLVDSIHNRVIEIKESNQYIIPEEIRHRFSEIYMTNVFSLVKYIQNDEIIVINKLKVIVQELQYIKGLKHEEIVKRDALYESIQHAKGNLMQYKLSREFTINELIRQEAEYETETYETKETPIEIPKEIYEVVDKSRFHEYVEDTILMMKNNIERMEVELNECNAKVERYRIQLEGLEQKKIKGLEEAIKHRKNYLNLNDSFTDEIEMDRLIQQGKWCDVCSWCKT
jgi:hypothetical protein